MDDNTLARTLKTIAVHIDTCRNDIPAVYSSSKDAYITVDPGSVSPFPSENQNRVLFLGCEHAVTIDRIDDIIRLFKNEKISRFFVWLSPSPQQTEIQEWLQDHDLTPFQGTGYPVLLRSTEPLSSHETGLTIRQITPEMLVDYAGNLKRIYPNPADQYLFNTSLGKPEFGHFIACDGDMAVAAGMVCMRNGLGYLYSGATIKAYRRQGAQSALIAARVNYAAAMGCAWVSSETLYMLKQSLRNLRHKGFRIVYERQVFVWNDSDD